MRNYRHRLKEYRKEDLVGKELYLIQPWWFADRINVEKLDIKKITDKTIVLESGGRIPIIDVGLNKEFGRLVCPKEDIDEIIGKFRKFMSEMYQTEISRLKDEIRNLNNARVILQPSHKERRQMKEEDNMTKYYDKNGKEVKAGMTLKHDDGDVDLVYECETDEGKKDLGFNASNENHVNFHELNRKIYPLYQFNMKEWEVVEDGK
jgi:hypothetical protein